MRERVYLYDAIRSNHIRIALSVLIFLAVVSIDIFLLVISFIPSKENNNNLPEMIISMAIGAVFLLAIFFVLIIIACRKGLFMIFESVELPPMEKRKLELALEDVCLASGMKMPEVKVVKMGGVNAASFPGGPVILVSERAVMELDRRELEALLAHEAYHIMSHDNWLWVFGLGLGFFLPFFYDMGFDLEGIDSRPKRLFLKGANTLFFIFVIVVCVIPLGFIFLPIFIFTIAFFSFILPKQREYLADDAAVLTTRNPEAVIGAIEKSEEMRIESLYPFGSLLNHMLFNRPRESENVISRFIENSINVHPDARERIDRIRAME